MQSHDNTSEYCMCGEEKNSELQMEIELVCN